MKINTLSYSPQFGMSMTIQKDALLLLKERNTTKEELSIIQELYKRQKDNPVNIDFSTDNSNKLTAKILVPKKLFEQVTEGYWEQMIHRPHKFIAKCCKKADFYKDKYFKQ